MDDDEEFDFEYEDEDDDDETGENQGQVDLENKYYNAKAVKEDDAGTAIEMFQSIVDAESEKGDWCDSLFSTSNFS